MDNTTVAKKTAAKTTLKENFGKVGGLFLDKNIKRKHIHLFHVTLCCENHDAAADYCNYARVSFTKILTRIYKAFEEDIANEPKIHYAVLTNWLIEQIPNLTPTNIFVPSPEELLHLSMIDEVYPQDLLWKYFDSDFNRFSQEAQRRYLTQICSEIVNITSE